MTASQAAAAAGATPPDVGYGVLLVAGMFFSTASQGFFQSHNVYNSLTTGLGIRSVFLGSVFEASLALGSSARQRFTNGQLVNLISVDAQKFRDTSMRTPCRAVRCACVCVACVCVAAAADVVCASV
jgi:hypothetical protein